MVAVGAQPAMLGAADSVLLHLPIFNRRSPCMMHNLPNNRGERDQSGPRWPGGLQKDARSLDVLESLSVRVAAEQCSDS
jgi:hypothetical protein